MYLDIYVCLYVKKKEREKEKENEDITLHTLHRILFPSPFPPKPVRPNPSQPAHLPTYLPTTLNMLQPASTGTPLTPLASRGALHALKRTPAPPQIKHAPLAPLPASRDAAGPTKRATQSPACSRGTRVSNADGRGQPQTGYLVFADRQDAGRGRGRVAQGVGVEDGEQRGVGAQRLHFLFDLLGRLCAGCCEERRCCRAGCGRGFGFVVGEGSVQEAGVLDGARKRAGEGAAVWISALDGGRGGHAAALAAVGRGFLVRVGLQLTDAPGVF